MTEKIIAGYVATFLSVSGTMPQIIHTYRTKKTNDLSLFMTLLVPFKRNAY